MSFFPFAPSAGALKAWQFTPETYGALGNGQVAGDVGVNGTSTATSPTIGALGAAAIGMSIMIHGANGNTALPYIGTITAVAGNNVTLSGTAPTATVSNCPAVFGTDDTAAFNSCLAAMGTYAMTRGAASGSGGYMAEMILASKFYILAAAPTQLTSPVQFNAQVTLPYPNVNGTTQKLMIAITGAGTLGNPMYWESLIPNLAGSCLVSMQTAPSTVSPTFGHQSVIGGPSGSGGLTGGYANVKAVCKGFAIWCPIYTNMYAFDFGYVTQMRVQECTANIFAPTGVNLAAVVPYLNNLTAAPFTGSIGAGLRSPVSGNNSDIYVDEMTVQGYEQGWVVFDHFTAGRLTGVYLDVVLKNDGTLGASGTQHGIFIQSINPENYNGGFRTNGGTLQVDINWDSENAATPVYDVNDAGNALFGLFRFGNKVNNIAPIISGASNLLVINDNLPPGHWSGAPAVPASGTAQQNTAWRPASIVVHTGAGVTVSAVTIDGTVTGLTLAASSSLALPVVPNGKNITLTYAGGTPTWDWWLD